MTQHNGFQRRTLAAMMAYRACLLGVAEQVFTDAVNVKFV